MRFEKQRFCGKLFQKTSGIEIPRYLKNRFFACGNGNGKTAFLARGNGNGNTAAVPTSGVNPVGLEFFSLPWTKLRRLLRNFK